MKKEKTNRRNYVDSYCEALTLFMICGQSTDTLNELMRSLVACLISITEHADDRQECYEHIIDMLRDGYYHDDEN